MHRDYPVIDTDIHAVLSSRRVMERLPEPWRSRWASGNRGPGHLGYWNPNGVMRSDTGLPDGSRVESSPDNLARHFLDHYGIEYGILNAPGDRPPKRAFGAPRLHIGLSPEPNYAAAVVSLVGSYMAHLISLVTEGVFQRFPTLKFVLIEGGVSWLPPLLWRFDKNWKSLRQTAPWLDRLPSEVVTEHVRLTTGVPAPATGPRARGSWRSRTTPGISGRCWRCSMRAGC